jgi:hypothetical protein
VMGGAALLSTGQASSSVEHQGGGLLRAGMAMHVVMLSQHESLGGCDQQASTRSRSGRQHGSRMPANHRLRCGVSWPVLLAARLVLVSRCSMTEGQVPPLAHGSSDACRAANALHAVAASAANLYCRHFWPWTHTHVTD